MADIVITVNKNEINTKLPGKFVLICFASFEQRSTTIPLSIDSEKINSAVIFRSLSVDNQIALNEMSGRIVNKKVIDLDLDTPIDMATTLASVVTEISATEGVSLVIDITAFTHESLLMLLKLVYDNRKKFASILCLYNGASDYSNSNKDGFQQMWLSKGCRDVRNVVGYPGLIRPIAKTCLIILTGFELERATRLIEILEPDKLILGKGNDSTHPNHDRTMEYFRKKFEDWKDNYKNNDCNELGFSCKNVHVTIKVLNDFILEYPNDNYIIVPLNTKISTVAAALVALHNPNIQICYAIPEVYNTDTYSTPSDDITVLDLYEQGMFWQ